MHRAAHHRPRRGLITPLRGRAAASRPRALLSFAAAGLLLAGCTGLDAAAPTGAPTAPPAAGTAAVTSAPGGAAADDSAPDDSAPDDSAPDDAAPDVDAAPGDAAGTAHVRALLAALPVKGRAPKTGYSRDLFGQAWSDDVAVDGGHNGCDTRNDILRRDLTGITVKPGTHGCTVLTGVLEDPYTGTRIAFTRGRDTSSAVQIDHLVALSDAWQKGARQLSPEQRRDLANDPLNLQAVDGPANARKSDGDAATWLPPNKAYRCTYVSRQVEVKARYGLWVTAAERDAIARVLDTCGAAAPPADPAVPPADAAGPAVAPAAADPASGAVRFDSCAAARAAGAAPLHAGDPGYRTGLDGDRDGVACE